jgi:preprotein translocase subunit SecB
MTDQQQAHTANFMIQKIYIKDLSFEAPNSPAIFTENWKPQANMEMNTNFEKIDERHYEVVLKLTITAKLEEKVAFIIELKQAGIFLIENIEENNLNALLHGYCPTALFPYARDAIASQVFRGSFPELNLAPINFDALYLQGQAQQVNTSAIN